MATKKILTHIILSLTVNTTKHFLTHIIDTRQIIDE